MPKQRHRAQPCQERRRRNSNRRGTQARDLPGVVYGPEGIPLSDAIVYLPSLNRSTRTGIYGEFNFGTVPASALGQLRVEAAGREIEIDLGAETLSPLAIHFEIRE